MKSFFSWRELKHLPSLPSSAGGPRSPPFRGDLPDADTWRRRARMAASREQPRCCLSVCAPHGGQSGLEGSCTGAAKRVLSSLLRVRSSAPLDERSCALTRPSRCSSTTFSAPTPSSLPLFQPPLWRSCCSSLSCSCFTQQRAAAPASSAYTATATPTPKSLSVTACPAPPSDAGQTLDCTVA